MTGGSASLRPSWWRRHGRLLCLGVGLALLCTMVWAAGPRLLWQQLLGLRWWLAATVAVWGVGYVLNAAAWALIVGVYPLRQSLSAWRLLRLTVTGFAINYVTPFGLLGGEPYRVVALRRYLGLEAATSSVVLYLMMHVTSHLLFWIGSCLLAALTLGGLSAPVAWCLWLASAACLAGLWLFLRGYRRGAVRSAVRLAERCPWAGRRVGAWRMHHAAQLERIDGGIASLLGHHRARFAGSLALEVASRVVNCAEVWLLMAALGMPVGYGDAVLVVALSSLLANLLFFAPLQMGTREGGILLALQLIRPEMGLGVLMPLAVAVSLATRIREFVWIAIGLGSFSKKS